MRWVILAGLLLSGCVVAAPFQTPQTFRDRDVQIESLREIDSAELDGVWLIRGSFQDRREGTRIAFRSHDRGLSLTLLPPVEALTEGLPPGAMNTFSGDTASLRAAGPGRWRAAGRARLSQDTGAFAVQVQGVLGNGEVWLLWADPQLRTIVLGNPRGTLGLILACARTGGEDRITAAQDAMAAMGYRVEEMVIP